MVPSELATSGLLPIPRTRLIGREDERAQSRTLLLDDAVPLLTLTGAGGSGKTRLALAVAHDAMPRFADGVVWVDLAPVTDPAQAPAAVAAALGVVPVPNRPVAESVVWALRTKQMLLVLDNCEQVLDAVALLTGAVLTHCPAIQILATSRAPLLIQGEQRFPVDPLPVPKQGAQLAGVDALEKNDAIRLFVARFRSVRPGFQLDNGNATTVALICQALDGLPLAIELAAARGAMNSPAALLAQMPNRLTWLRDDARDRPARQETIAATIAWSYGLLGFNQQALFRRLAVFSGGFTLDAAESVVGSPNSTDVAAGLTALVDQSLVKPVDDPGAVPRFTMLETIREFGIAQLTISGETQRTRDRHASYFLALAEQAELHLHGISGDQAAWMARMDLEYGNIRAAIVWLLEQGDGIRVLRFLVGLEAYTGARYFAADARRWAETALAMTPSASASLRAAALYGLISRAAETGDNDAALAAAMEALALVETDDDPFAHGRAHFGVGIAHGLRGEITASAAALHRAIPFLRQTNRLDFLVIAVSGLGDRLHQIGELAAARELLDEALGYNTGNDPWGHAVALEYRASLAITEGDYPLAVRLLRSAHTAAQSVRDQTLIIGQIIGLAAIAMETGQPERAARLLGAVTVAQEAGGNRWIASDVNMERIVTEARTAIDAQTFRRAWDSGRKLPWAEAVANALSVLESEPAAPSPALDASRFGEYALTRREREVLSLLGQRWTDPEIAAALFLSPRTVSTHVANIFGKFGVTNRRDAITIAARQGLLASVIPDRAPAHPASSA